MFWRSLFFVVFLGATSTVSSSSSAFSKQNITKWISTPTKHSRRNQEVISWTCNETGGEERKLIWKRMRDRSATTSSKSTWLRLPTTKSQVTRREFLSTFLKESYCFETAEKRRRWAASNYQTIFEWMEMMMIGNLTVYPSHKEKLFFFSFRKLLKLKKVMRSERMSTLLSRIWRGRLKWLSFFDLLLERFSLWLFFVIFLRLVCRYSFASIRKGRYKIKRDGIIHRHDEIEESANAEEQRSSIMAEDEMADTHADNRTETIPNTIH